MANPSGGSPDRSSLPVALLLDGAASDIADVSRVLNGWQLVPDNRSLEIRARLPELDPEIHLVVWRGAELDEREITTALASAGRRFPETPVVLIVRVDDLDSRMLLRSRLWNKVGIVFEGVDDAPGAIERTLREARAVWLAAAVVRALPVGTPVWVRAYFSRAIAHAYLPLARRRLASFLFVGVRALNKRLRRFGLPSVKNAIGLGKAFCASAEVAWGFEKVGSVAMHLHCRQVRSLRSWCRRFVGCTPSRLPFPGVVPMLAGRLRGIVEGAAARFPTVWTKDRQRLGRAAAKSRGGGG